ncbi:D-Ala-D-Ala carboxypeptidase family metallohydrolase [Pseudomonas akapageensis]|uniref:D-Ala-D-Ala carboxypeptidase family metallohydrolase n=1 Tax=Pseudomonas akapageensis TaxID=2609961 RepID=UPI0014081AA4|nr:D-Ala-D-Ala carboxypeptidase family metallohydrolase [Pseudomonas akapageensis]
MNLTPFFTLGELTVSETASRLGIENTPDPEVMKNLYRLATFLEDVRALAGGPVLVSSGYRSPALNKVIGGSARSAHMSGLAADFNVPGFAPYKLAALIAASQLAFDQLILEFDAWVHLGLALDKPRRQVLTIRKGTGYQSGLVMLANGEGEAF